MRLFLGGYAASPLQEPRGRMQDVPRVPPFDRPATYDDLLKVPERMVAEIVQGELHTSARPAFRHALAGSALGSLLFGPFHRAIGGGGWWIVYEPELHLAADVLVPDWRAGCARGCPIDRRVPSPRWPRTGCEIPSPSTAALDRASKLAVYAREGVPYAWLIDPAARTLEVLHLESGRWSILATHVGHETVRAAPFAEVEIPLAVIQRTRPQGPWKTADGFPQLPHALSTGQHVGDRP